MISSIKKISELVSKRQSRGLILLTFLLFIGMIFEIIGLGVIIPLLQAIVEPEKIRSYLDNFLTSDTLFNLTNKKLIYYLLIIVVLVYLIKSLFLIGLSFVQSKLITNIHVSLSVKLFEKYLRQEYASFISKHTSFYLKNIQNELTYLMNLCNSLMTVVVELFLLLAVVLTLILIEPLGAILISIFFLSFAFLYNLTTRNVLKSWSTKMLNSQALISKTIIDGFGGFVELKLLNKVEYLVNSFQRLIYEKAQIEIKYKTLQQTPRLLFELISITGLIGFIFYMLFTGINIESIITITGVFVAATFRMIPSIVRLVGAIQNLKHDIVYLDFFYEEFKRFKDAPPCEISFQEKIKFNREININSLNLAFDKSIIFKNFNLKIQKGTSIGIIGASGSGKSSLINVILGIINPTGGNIIVDDLNIKQNLQGWRKLIGYVPQNIFLFDDTIENNIALGVKSNEIDKNRILECIKLAELETYIESTTNGLNTTIGERGIKMSGGQKQRIGIARALYNNPEILIFDEATSALDEETEELVMNTIYNLDKNMTTLIVSHNVNSLKRCDKIIRL